MRSRRTFLALLAAAALAASAAGWQAGPARAQVFGPPMTIFGSVTDEGGTVPEDLPVEAYIGNRVCGRGLTQFTGEGDGRVTVYYADVVSREQTAGCGAPGAEVRVKIGDRFAPQTALWRAGPVQMDVTFGSATPAPIPTFTPTPREGGETATATTPPPTSTPAGPAQTPGPSPSPTATSTATATATVTPTPTLAGSLITRPAGGGLQRGAGDDGLPVWPFVVIGLGAIVAVGGGIGYLMARARRAEDEGDAGD